MVNVELLPKAKSKRNLSLFDEPLTELRGIFLDSFLRTKRAWIQVTC